MKLLEKIKDAIERLDQFFYDERLSELYGIESVEFQRERYKKLLKWHNSFYNEESASIISSPGRTELGGNHTDHNGGKVLAASIQLDSVAVVSKSGNNKVTMNSKNYPLIEVDLTDLTPQKEETGTTEALIRGIAAEFNNKGFKIGGFNSSVVSDVLQGSGLSSSASIEILIGSIFNSLFNDESISIAELAKIGKDAENIFFKKPCGLMDQLACGTGGIISIDFKNMKSPQITPVDFNFRNAGYSLMIINTGGSHSDMTEEYNSIPKDMFNAASVLGKKICRETTEVDILAEASAIREKYGDRTFLRAIHFFRENKRVSNMVDSLIQNDINKYLNAVKSSGDSSYKFLQNCYPSGNTSSQGISIALALSEGFLDGEGVSRVHGGGFAGTIQVYVPYKRADDYRYFMESFFGANSVIPLRIRDASAGPVLLT